MCSNSNCPYLQSARDTCSSRDHGSRLALMPLMVLPFVFCAASASALGRCRRGLVLVVLMGWTASVSPAFLGRTRGDAAGVDGILCSREPHRRRCSDPHSAPSLPHSLPRLREAAARCAGPHVAHQRLGLRGGGKKQKRRAKSTRHVLEDLARTSLRTSAVRPRKAVGNEGVAGAVPPLKILRTGMLGHCFDPAPLPPRPFAASAPSYGRAAGEAARQRLRQEQEAGRQWQQARVCKACDLSHSLPCLHPFTRVL